MDTIEICEWSVNVFFCAGLCQSARAYKIIEAVIISVLFIATIIISFCCGRQFRGERAITPDTFEEMEGTVNSIPCFINNLINMCFQV